MPRTPHPLLHTRSWFAACAVLFAACGSEEPPAPRDASAPPRNAVLITLDTTRADALGAYGAEPTPSPSIDAMAAEGVLFEQALASAPITLPSHASILTGKYPYAHGARSNFGHILSEANESIAEALRQRGYRTAAEIAAPVIGRRSGLAQGFETYRDLESLGVRRKQDAKAEDFGRERDAGSITRFGLRFLKEHADERFFLWLHYFDPHFAYSPPNPFRDRFAGDPYAGEIAYTDYQVGRVLRQIEDLGLRENTLVVLTADHGEGRGEHGEETHAFFVYDTTMRVPLVLWGPPELPEGRRVGGVVRTIDIAPTILDYLDRPALEEAQGVSLRPLVASARELDLPAYGESIELFSIFRTSVLRSFRRGRWKYIHTLRPELYDIDRDPGELRDLASANPAHVARLRRELEALLAEAPRKPTGGRVDVDPDTWEMLADLGYVGGGAPTDFADEVATLAFSGSDPVDQLEDLKSFTDGWSQLKAGDHVRAIEHFERLLERYPDSPMILYGRARGLIGLGRHAEAVPLLERAVEGDPGFESLSMDLAVTASRAGRPDVSERTLRAALLRSPCSSKPRIALTLLLAEQNRLGERLELLREGVEACRDSLDFRNDYAYALVTSSEDALRDGAKGLELAKSVVADSAGRQPAYLDTLAAAYAEVGDFENAVATSREALALLEGHETHPRVMAVFRGNLARFEAGEPVRE